MEQALSIFVPMFLFMLTPVFIPIVASLVGRLHDGLTGRSQVPSAAALATENARQTAAVRRAETAAENAVLVA